MSPPREGRSPVTATASLSVVAALTTVAALTAWTGFVTRPWDFLSRLAVIAAVVVVLGTVARAAGLPRWATTLLQLVVTSAVVSAQLTGSLLPTGAAGAEIGDLLRAALESSRTYSAPIGDDVPPVWPLLVIGGAFFLVLVDTVACTWRKVPGAGLALLAIYSVPSGLLDGGPGWPSFLTGALGFLVLLHLDSREQLLRWGRAVGPPQRSPWGQDNPVREAARAGAGRIGLVAVAAAVLGSTLVPVLDVAAFDLGTGSGDGEIRIRKPIADMRRDLQREADIPLITVRTDDPAPSYLRVSVLNRYTGNQWSSGDRDVASDDVADGRLPAPAGLSEDVPRREYDYQLATHNAFNSTWLPTTFPAAAVEAEGDWRFDPASMDFLAADDDLDTRGLRYSLTSLEPDYGTDGRFFGDARAASVDEQFTELPGIPDIARELAFSVTAPAANDYERALLLQRWFRRDGGFEYNLDRAPRGTGNQTLEGFLSPGGRVGYCEQYASAMAVMARVLGIPSRVAVGFLKPRKIADGVWEYSSHDLHAWPELYFSDAGWVRFEPTPAGRARTVPDYTQVPVAGAGIDLPSESASSGGTSDEETESVAPPTRATQPPEPEASDPAASAGEDAGSSHLLRSIVLGVLALGLLGLVVAAPRAAREQVRRRRLRGDPERLWSELRATAIDLRVPWPEGRSPREVASALAERLGEPGQPATDRPRTGPEAAPDAAEALERLLVTVERARYARTADDPRPAGSVPTAAADAELVLAALAAGTTARARHRATWWPRSLWRR